MDQFKGKKIKQLEAQSEMGLAQEQERLPSTGPLTMARAVLLQVLAEL